MKCEITIFFPKRDFPKCRILSIFGKCEMLIISVFLNCEKDRFYFSPSQMTPAISCGSCVHNGCPAYRPYAKMVVIHICSLVKFLATLMVTLENDCRNSLLLWVVSAFGVFDKMAGDLYLYGKSNPGLPWLVFMFLSIKFPCTFPLYKGVALTLNTLIYFDLIFS